MSEDKVRWKFEILSNLLNTSVEQQSKELDRTKNDFSNYERFMFKTRNEFLSGFGFAITIWIALIQIEILPDFHIIYIILLAILALIVFTLFNELIIRQLKIYRSLYKLYNKIIYDELFPFQHFLISKALLDKLTERDIIQYTEFVSILSNAQSFCLQVYGYKNLKHGKPDMKIFLPYFELAKKSIIIIDQIELKPIFQRFEDFIKEYEKIFKNSVA